MARQFLRVERVNIFAQIKKTGETLLSAAFPRFCVQCGSEGALLCAPCEARWVPHMPERTRFHLASFYYGDKIARQLIGAWKYDFDETAWELLRRMLERQNDAISQFVRAAGIEAVVPVSLHPLRARERGFDQSDRIADAVAAWCGIEKRALLIRHRQTGKQAERTTEERMGAMRTNPFVVVARPPSNVLLVDDVWTTGATARAARRALKAAGAERVYVYTLAKG